MFKFFTTILCKSRPSWRSEAGTRARCEAFRRYPQEEQTSMDSNFRGIAAALKKIADKKDATRLQRLQMIEPGVQTVTIGYVQCSNCCTAN